MLVTVEDLKAFIAQDQSRKILLFDTPDNIQHMYIFLIYISLYSLLLLFSIIYYCILLYIIIFIRYTDCRHKPNMCSLLSIDPSFTTYSSPSPFPNNNNNNNNSVYLAIYNPSTLELLSSSASKKRALAWLCENILFNNNIINTNTSPDTNLNNNNNNNNKTDLKNQDNANDNKTNVLDHVIAFGDGDNDAEMVSLYHS